jgi:hypothetical protein
MNSQQIQEQKGRTTVEVIDDVFNLNWTPVPIINVTALNANLARILMRPDTGRKIKCHPLFVPYIQ